MLEKHGDTNSINNTIHVVTFYYTNYDLLTTVY